MTRRVRSRSIVLALLVVSAGVPGLLVQPAAGTSCEVTTTAGITNGGDGHWWVLETTHWDRQAAVYEYDEDWNHVANHSVGSEIVEHDDHEELEWGRQFAGLARGDDGWWIVGESGILYRFDETWSYTGESRMLPTDGRARDVERTGDTWWVLTESGLYAFDESWDSIGSLAFSDETGYSPVGLHATEAALWLLDAANDPAVSGRIRRYAVVENGGNPSLARLGSTKVGWEVDAVGDVHPAGDGWIVLGSDGTVADYTRYGQHTGRSREVTTASGYCEPVSTTDPLLFVIGAGLASGLALAALFDLRNVHWYVTSSLTSVPVAGAFLTFALPWPLSLVYWVPDLLLGCLLGGAILWQATSLSDLSSSIVRRAIVVSLVDLPVAYVAALFFLSV